MSEKVIHVELTQKQQDQVRKYLDEHYCEQFFQNSGGFGSTSKLSYIVGRTMIGPTLRLTCPYCGYIEDITDIDTW